MTRQEIVDTPVTLDGWRAVVVGIKQDFCRVAIVDPRAPVKYHFEWSWQTAERIITERQGRFLS